MNRLEKLEFSIIELGTELFDLKQRLESYNQQQNDYDRVINSLKVLLQERGILNSDDLDLILDMNDTKNRVEFDENDLEDNIITNKRGFH